MRIEDGLLTVTAPDGRTKSAQLGGSYGAALWAMEHYLRRRNPAVSARIAVYLGGKGSVRAAYPTGASLDLDELSPGSRFFRGDTSALE